MSVLGMYLHFLISSVLECSIFDQESGCDAGIEGTAGDQKGSSIEGSSAICWPRNGDAR